MPRGLKALWVPGTGIVDYAAVARKYAELIAAAGGEVRAGRKSLTGMRQATGRRRSSCCSPPRARCATQAAHQLRRPALRPHRAPWRRQAGCADRSVPRRILQACCPEHTHLVKGLIYPVPDPRFPFLGVHFTRMIDGGVEAGPNAVLAFKREGYTQASASTCATALRLSLIPASGAWRCKYWRMGLGEMYRSFSKAAFVRALQRLMPEIQSAHLETGGAGVRAQALQRDGALLDDFRIMREGRAIHVLNAPSPAATASLCIGEEIAETVMLKAE